jgi:signal transduction histidine kinase
MLHSARTRLALTYLGIIMVLSLGFSLFFYHQSTTEANNGFRRQSNQLGPNLYFTQPAQLDRIQTAGQRTFSNRLIGRLFLLNIGMLAVGAVASFYLAERSLKPLEESLEAQARFTSDAAHELRTPLTAMKTEIEVNMRGKLTETEAKELLKSNLEEISKLESLTSALLRLAKNSQDTSLALDIIELESPFRAAVDRVAPQAAQKHIELDVPTMMKQSVRGDNDQLTELFAVLLDNAVKYSPEKTKVKVTASKIDKQVLVTIADEGIGIRQEDLEHIFERFYRADQSRNKSVHPSGYGLGLSLAESIMKAHKGVIKVSSQVDKGTTFILEFPTV